MKKNQLWIPSTKGRLVIQSAYSSKKSSYLLKNKKLELNILLRLEVFENLIKARLGITKQHARIFFKE